MSGLSSGHAVPSALCRNAPCLERGGTGHSGGSTTASGSTPEGAGDKCREEAAGYRRYGSILKCVLLDTYRFSVWDFVRLQAKLEIFGLYTKDFFAKYFINSWRKKK